MAKDLLIEEVPLEIIRSLSEKIKSFSQRRPEILLIKKPEGVFGEHRETLNEEVSLKVFS